MVQYKLYYFPFKGLAEGLRLLLNHVEADFEDVHISMEDWKAGQKSKMPMQVLPVLEVDGKQLSQTMAIAQLIAEPHGLIPKDPWQRAKAQEAVFGWFDMISKFVAIMSVDNHEKKKEIFQELKSGFIPARLNFYNENLGNSGSGFIADELCWADFILFNWFEGVEGWFEVDYSAYPHIEAFRERVGSIASVKSWREKHPDVPFSPFNNIAKELN